jgi:predicted amidophosphoribosyltransferase
MGRSPAGFQDSKSGKTSKARFFDLDEKDVRKIQDFIEWYERVWCISTNKHLEKDFSDELDFCIALDSNRPAPERDRTELGEWEYRAKYGGDTEALRGLAKELCRAIRMLPPARLPKPRLLTYVPPEPGKGFDLAAELAKAVVRDAPTTFWGVGDPLMVPALTADKKSAKNLTVAQKIAQWDKIIKAEGIRLSRSVKDCTVIVVDDLYQSGATLWSMAKYLKSRKAAFVVALACVKSLRDTDNQ